VVQELGFGFLVVFNGRTFAQIKEAADATKLGASDGVMAVSSARHEGFPAGTIIFLDQEEGGRLLPEQRGYLHAWGRCGAIRRVLERVCIVPASLSRKALVPQSSPLRIFDRTQVEEGWRTGWPTLRVRPRRVVCYQATPEPGR